MTLSPTTHKSGDSAYTSVSLFDRGLVQVVQAAVTGLEPRHPCVLALASHADGGGPLQQLASFTTNPAGAAIVAIGPIRQLLRGNDGAPRRFLVIAPGPDAPVGSAIQVQTDWPHASSH